MESALGTQLFDRVGRRLVLNENGQTLLPQAIRLLEAAAQIEEGFQKGHDGSDEDRLQHYNWQLHHAPADRTFGCASAGHSSRCHHGQQCRYRQASRTAFD
nr:MULTISPECIES: hypothetical protein [Pseudomonas]